MWFLTFVLKNVARRPLRSVLTVTAIAIAIGSVVALVGIATGFERSFLQLYQNVGIDLIVVRAGGTQRLNSALPETLGDEMLKIPGVKEVLPGLVDVTAFEDRQLYAVVLQGWVPESAAFEHLKTKEGRPLTLQDKKAVVLGTVLARNLDKKVGDVLPIYEKNFEVVGIYESPNVYENGALVIPLAEMQEVSGKKGQVTGLSLILDDEARRSRIPEIRKEVEALAPNISALPTKEHVSSLTEIRMAKAMAWLTSAIALVIGTFGIMNTMVMAVHERTREIGILRAVGWRRGRVMRMVLMEAVALSVAGAFVGIVGAVVLVRLLTMLPAASGLLDGRIAPIVMLQGLLIALAVGLLGGVLPAQRAAGMLPTEALRHE